MASYHFRPSPSLLYALLPICLLLLTFGSGCRTPKSNYQADLAEPFILFQKTPCYGSCPAYDAIITTNGTVRFVGRQHVPTKDTLLLQLPEKELADLRTDVQQLDYRLLDNAYLSQWTDIPATITTFYEDGREVKRIKHQEGGPERLVQFQKRLDQLIMDLVAPYTQEQKD